MRDGDVVPEELAAERSLPRQLAAAGYRAAAFVTSGSLGAGAFGLGGFEPYDEQGRGPRPGADAVASALAWLDRIGHGERRPIFIWVHLCDARSPYGDAAEKQGQFPPDPKSYGWVDRRRYARKEARVARATQYAAGVREADAGLGQLLDGLAARDLEPLVLVAADHGELMAEHLDRLGFAFGHGPLLASPVLWIPLVVAAPGAPAARVPGAVSLADLYTTILASAGIGDASAEQEGRIDLRGDPPPGRVVAAARRLLGGKARKQRGIDAAALRHIAAHAVAVSDGGALLFVGEDGRPSDPKAKPPERLAAAASAALAAQRAGEQALRKASVAADARGPERASGVPGAQ
jgi:arylsulfatase A-like enzyme